MSIEKQWKELGENNDGDLSALLKPGKVRTFHSSNPLKKIKKNLLANMIWAILIAALYVFVLYHFRYWQVVLCIGCVLLFTILGGFSSYFQYSKIKPNVLADETLLSEMERHYNAISKWVSLQTKIGVFIYPFAVIGGFLAGGSFGSGKSVETFLSKPIVIPVLLISLVVLVPVAHFLGKWLLRKSFGKHLDALKENIDALKAQ